MDYHVGDIVEFNFNCYLWPSLPSVECEVIEAKRGSAGVYKLKLSEKTDSILIKRLVMDDKDTFWCYQDWFRPLSNKSLQVDTSELL